MVFDYTKGKKANYSVSIYRWSFSDRCLFHTYEEAKKCYDRSIEADEEKGTFVTLFDLNDDNKALEQKKF